MPTITPNNLKFRGSIEKLPEKFRATITDYPDGHTDRLGELSKNLGDLLIVWINGDLLVDPLCSGDYEVVGDRFEGSLMYSESSGRIVCSQSWDSDYLFVLRDWQISGAYKEILEGGSITYFFSPLSKTRGRGFEGSWAQYCALRESETHA